MSDSTAKYTDDEESELEDNQTKKKQKKAVAYYVIGPAHSNKCKCCRELEKRDPEPMPDVNDYLSPKELIEVKDEGARLRMAHYWKMRRQSGGFYVDCPPSVGGYRTGNIFNEAHFVGYRGIKFMRNESIKFGIKESNKETGKQMKLLQIMNVTVTQGGCHMIFFVTFECFEPFPQGTSPYVDIYQAVVSYDMVYKTCHVFVFRRKSDGKDLLKPRCTLYAAMSRYPIPEACS